MSDTRTGPLVQKLVDAVDEDLDDIVGHLSRGLELMRSLQSDAKGVNGLSGFLKGQGDQLQTMLDHLSAERKDVAGKMLPKRPEIAATVNADQLEAVKAAKAGA